MCVCVCVCVCVCACVCGGYVWGGSCVGIHKWIDGCVEREHYITFRLGFSEAHFLEHMG